MKLYSDDLKRSSRKFIDEQVKNSIGNCTSKHFGVVSPKVESLRAG